MFPLGRYTRLSHRFLNWYSCDFGNLRDHRGSRRPSGNSHGNDLSGGWKRRWSRSARRIAEGAFLHRRRDLASALWADPVEHVSSLRGYASYTFQAHTLLESLSYLRVT